MKAKTMTTLTSTIDIQTQPAADQYKGCGKAWVAINDQGQIVGIRYMDNHGGCLTGYAPEALQRAGRKRYCPASQWAAEEINRELFLNWRKQAKADLAELGTVVSGIMSCYPLISY
jgi:hypothetical protein